MSEEIMSGSATTLSPRLIRWILIAASVFALLGSVAAPAQAGDYYGPSRYGYGYNYNPYRYGNGCSSCGCVRCGCGGCRPHVRRGGVYERRYVEREYIERRYVAPIRRYPRYGYGCCGPSRSYYGGYQGYRSPFPYGYGGVRSEGYGYAPAAYQYEEPLRPPAPVGYDVGAYDAGNGWDPQ
jgi:hypothetical protein